MPKIIQGYNDVKLVIAGKGGMLDDLKAQAEAMGIANKIYFTGYLNAKQVQKYINVQMWQYFQALMNHLE